MTRKQASEVVAQHARKAGVPVMLLTTKALGRKNEDLVRCRAEIACELRRNGMSYPQIGRLLNLHHTSVMYLVGKFGEAAEAKRLQDTTIPVPDLSGEWAI